MTNNSYYHYCIQVGKTDPVYCINYHEVTALLKIQRHQMNYIIRNPEGKKFKGIRIERIKEPVYERRRRDVRQVVLEEQGSPLAQ